MNYTRFIKFWHILQGKNITRKRILVFFLIVLIKSNIRIFFFFKVLIKSNEFSCTNITFVHVFCILLLAPMKNAIDWASRPPNAWANKAAAIVSTGGNGGGERAQYHLRQVGVFIDLHFINTPLFSLNAFEQPAKFDKDGNLISAETKERLKGVLLALHEFTLRIQGK